MNYIIMLGIIILSNIIFIIMMISVFKSKKNQIKKDLIEQILLSQPNPSIFNTIKHLGQENLYGWIWNNQKIQKLSYKELINIYNIIYFKEN